MHAVVVKDTVYLLYRAQDRARVSYIGLAHSKDGIQFERLSQPILWPEYDYEKMGIEDPRITTVNETYYLTYTGYDGGRARLCTATSENFREWEKLGPVFPEWPWTKSGAILPVKVNGKYVMYFGDSTIWIAYSNDLVHWSADRGDVVLRPRRNNFDSKLVEPGPPPMLTEEGILLIYNGASWEKGYSVGWVIFSKEDPTKVACMQMDSYWSNKYANATDVTLEDETRYSTSKEDIRSLGKQDICTKFRMCAARVFGYRRVDNIVDK